MQSILGLRMESTRITQFPLLGERQRSHSGEDQHEEMIQKVPHVEKEEVLTVFHG